LGELVDVNMVFIGNFYFSVVIELWFSFLNKKYDVYVVSLYMWFNV